MLLIDPWREFARHVWQPHHMEWMRAAKTLPFCARMNAYRDIALMLGIKRSQVEDKAVRMRKSENRVAKIAAE